MSTRVYISSASREWQRAAHAATLLAELSHGRIVPAAQWWLGADKWTGLDHTLSRESAKALAAQARFAVVDADAFLLLAPERPTIGAPVEFGYAIAVADMRKQLGKPEYPIHVAGERHRASMFYELAVTSEHVSESCARIVRWDNVRRELGEMRGAA